MGFIYFSLFPFLLVCSLNTTEKSLALPSLHHTIRYLYPLMRPISTPEPSLLQAEWSQLAQPLFKLKTLQVLCFAGLTPVCPCLSLGAQNLVTLELDTALQIRSFTFTICVLKFKVFGLSAVLMHREQIAATSALVRACNIPS